MSELLLAIDVGTSVTKAAAVDMQGTCVAVARELTPVRYPAPDRAESDPDCWWPQVARCVREVLDQEVDTDRIVAVGVSGFMHTLVPVAAGGSALHPALLWPDQRCRSEVCGLSAEGDQIKALTGRPLTTLSSLPRLRWLRAHAPAAVDGAAHWLCVKDVVRLHLTGEVATDRHDAEGVGLVDVRTGAWSEDLLRLAGLDAARLPSIRAPDAIAGQVTSAAAADCGLRAGTPVVVGSGDWFSTLTGSGCALPERACAYLGSAGIIGAFASRTELDRLGATRYFGSVTSTGTARLWIEQLLYGPGEAPGCNASPPGARGLLFLPHLMGERGGTMRPGARGVLYGLTLAHGREDVHRAVLEGTAMWLRTICGPRLAEVEVGDLMLFGGGARSALWRRICAAVLERRLLVPDCTEGALIGVAMMAAVGAGLARGYADLSRRWSRVAFVEEPAADLVETYRAQYERFRNLEAALAPLDAQTV